MPALEARPFAGKGLADALREPPSGLEWFWLGQAGLLFRAPGLAWLVDPYLSDQLAEKYRGHTFSHERMMPAPITPAELPPLEWIFCTHHHGDHLDLPTLRALAEAQPKVRFALPAGSQTEVNRWGLPEGRITWAEAGVGFDAAPQLRVVPLPAAHEEFGFDDAGRHRFLGYVFRHANGTVYHSGDTVSYAGLQDVVRAQAPDVALLPVNGRHPELTRGGIAGNLTLTEAVHLCREAAVPALVAHHYGMFAFNTVPPETIDAETERARGVPRLFRAQLGIRYRMVPIVTTA